jgi:hypothetical protein
VSSGKHLHLLPFCKLKKRNGIVFSDILRIIQAVVLDKADWTLVISPFLPALVMLWPLALAAQRRVICVHVAVPSVYKRLLLLTMGCTPYISVLFSEEAGGRHSTSTRVE